MVWILFAPTAASQHPPPGLEFISELNSDEQEFRCQILIGVMLKLFFIEKLALELAYGSFFTRPRHAHLKGSSVPLCQSETRTQRQGKENKAEQ